MKTEDSFKIKIQKLQPWFPLLIKDIKKDIKTDLPREQSKIYQRHFAKTHFSKLSLAELTTPLLQEVLEGNENLGEWLSARWVVKNSTIYDFFARQLSQINPAFDQIEILDDAQGEALIRGAIQYFGAQKTYIFSVLNSVAFSSIIFERLAGLAREESIAQDE